MSIKDKYNIYSYKKKNNLLKLFVVIFVFLFIIIVIILIINTSKSIKKYYKEKNLRESYKKLFKDRDFISLIEKMDYELKNNQFIPEFLVYRGYSFFFLGENEKKNIRKQKAYFTSSLIDLRKALAIGVNEKNKSNIFFCLGKIYYYFGPAYYNLSIKYLKKAIEEGNQNIDLFYILGLVFSYNGEYDEAIKYFYKALKIKESDYLLLTIGICFYKKNDYENAINLINNVIKISEDPKIRERAYFILGEIYFNQKKYSDSLDMFNKVIELNENNSEAYFYRGEIYFLYYNDKVKARAEWRKTLIIDPGYIRALKRIY